MEIEKKIIFNEKSNKNVAEMSKLIKKKYFNIWKKKLNIKNKKEMNQKDTTEMVDDLIKNIELFQKNENNCRCGKTSVEVSIKKKTYDMLQNEITNLGYDLKSTKTFSCRFKAQSDIIKTQKIKLEEQSKLIEMLKLGKIEKYVNISLNDAKVNIRDIFKNCRKINKNKDKSLIFDENHKAICKFDVIFTEAPKIIRKMDKKAFERSVRREFILKKRKLIEEERKRVKQLEIENKKAQDKEERKKYLEFLEKKRKAEIEKKAIRQKNKEKYLIKMHMAENFYNKKLLRRSFDMFKKLIIIQKLNDKKAIIFNRKNTLKTFLVKWKTFLSEKEREKYYLADQYSRHILIKRAFKKIYQVYHLSRQNMQVAKDYNDYKIQNKYFKALSDYSCEIYVLHKKQLKIAEENYRRRLLLNYYFSWKTLPSILKLEKTKEERKRKWREKVCEIIPNFTINCND